MLQSVFLAFALYSRIPLPQAEWNEKNMRYCICFLPLVGAVIGAVQYGMFLLLGRIFAGTMIRGAILAALPVFLSGGIHMDGFMDTCDAIHSWKGREERLRILKDPHTGAFAVLGCLLYMLLQTGVWTEACMLPADSRLLLTLCLCFVLSRALSAFAALAFPKAKKDGLLRQETDPAFSGAAAAMAVASAASTALLVYVGHIPGLCACAAAAAMLLYYYLTAKKLFGGTTGDLAGWFLQLCELFAGAAALTAFELANRV